MVCKTMRDINLKHFAFFLVKCHYSVLNTEMGLQVKYLDITHMRKIGRVKEKIELINRLKTDLNEYFKINIKLIENYECLNSYSESKLSN